MANRKRDNKYCVASLIPKILGYLFWETAEFYKKIGSLRDNNSY